MEYALRRQEKQGATISTINHELRTLAGVLRLASRNGKLRQFPTIEFLRGDQVQDEIIRPRGVFFQAATRGEPIDRGSRFISSSLTERLARERRARR